MSRKIARIKGHSLRRIRRERGAISLEQTLMLGSGAFFVAALTLPVAEIVERGLQIVLSSLP